MNPEWMLERYKTWGFFLFFSELFVIFLLSKSFYNNHPLRDTHTHTQVTMKHRAGLDQDR